MILLAIEAYPTLECRPGFAHHANGSLAGFQTRALLDVNFDVPRNGQIELITAQIADGLQGVLKADAVAIATVPGGLQRQRTSKYTATDQTRLKTCTLLVGPVDHGQVAGRDFTALAHLPRQAGHRDSTCKHTVDAVKAPRARLAVQV